MGLHLDSMLTLLTKNKYLSRVPTDPESLRTKYRVMTNLWLLAQLRQPGRQLYADLSKDTFNDFLEELLSTHNFRMKRQIEGETWSAPMWARCKEYEFQLRREAMTQCREQKDSIQAASWAAYRHQEHRVKHWVTLFSIAATSSKAEETSCPAPEDQIQLPTGCQRVRKKFSKLSSSTRFYCAGFQ